jgi:hypothetical protein
VRWGLARALAAGGNAPYSTSELHKVRAVFLSLGMSSHATEAMVDVVRMKFDSGEDVRDLCAEIVPVLTQAGLTYSAIEVLTYLREQKKNGMRTTRSI